jgi:hypothetical protein
MAVDRSLNCPIRVELGDRSVRAEEEFVQRVAQFQNCVFATMGRDERVWDAEVFIGLF